MNLRQIPNPAVNDQEDIHFSMHMKPSSKYVMLVDGEAIV